MSVGLRGDLQDFGIADVFQLIGQQRKSGVLDIRDSDERVQLVFDSGAIVSAAPIGAHPFEALGDMLVRCGLLPRDKVNELQRECEVSALPLPRLAVQSRALSDADLREGQDLLTRDTIFGILLWKSGSFDFTAGDIDHDRASETLLGAEQILMDGLRMVDEWQTFADRVPPDDAICRQRGDFEDYARLAQGEARRETEKAHRVFSLIDGRQSVRDVIDLSRLGSFDATRVLAEMVRIRLVESLGAEDVSRLHGERTRRPAVTPKRWRQSAVPAVWPFAVLIAVALLCAGAAGLGGRTSARGTDMGRDPLAEARASYESRRMRHAIESFRFIRGEWPTDLSEVADEGLLPAAALTPQSARPYYYARRDDGAILLAPDR